MEENRPPITSSFTCLKTLDESRMTKSSQTALSGRRPQLRPVCQVFSYSGLVLRPWDHDSYTRKRKAKSGSEFSQTSFGACIKSPAVRLSRVAKSQVPYPFQLKTILPGHDSICSADLPDHYYRLLTNQPSVNRQVSSSTSTDSSEELAGQNSLTIAFSRPDITPQQDNRFPSFYTGICLSSTYLVD